MGSKLVQDGLYDWVDLKEYEGGASPLLCEGLLEKIF